MRNKLIVILILSLIFTSALGARSHKKRGDNQTNAGATPEKVSTEEISQEYVSEENNVSDNLGSALNSASQAVGDVFGSLGDSVGNIGEAGNSLGQGVNNVADNVGQATNGLGETVQDGVDGTQQNAESELLQVKKSRNLRKVENKEQPNFLQKVKSFFTKSKKFVTQKVLGITEEEDNN
ncbi:hypothetical protein ABPG74_022024 [Tetrahymena malaccensis]